MCLQDIRRDIEPTADHYFEGHGPLFLELAQSDLPVEISVHKCNSTTLLELPRNVRCLTLAQSVARMDYKGLRFDDCQQVFHRFSMLKVLQLGDFLTSDLVSMFEGVCMPQLDTFGFSLNSYIYLVVRKKYCKDVNGETVWSVSENVGNLAVAFPALKHFKVLFSGILEDTHVLDVRFMSKALFPKLRGVTCCSAQLNFVLRNFSPSCYLVNKLDNQ